ncbi:MAG: hypothetical protein HDT28_01695 [Clostridiales bacterium]|nr:hypothetical protein [Clostridiales bacterium]
MTKTRKISLTVIISVLAAFALLLSAVTVLGTSSASAEITGGVTANTAGARIAYGPGWGDTAAAEVNAAFEAKLTELGITTHGNVEIYNNANDGDAVVFGMTCTVDGKAGYLMYNVLNKKVYLVTDGFEEKKGEVRRIGAPVSDKLTGIKVTGHDGEGHAVNATNASVQVFETGILINEDGTVQKHEGVVEKISDTEYKIYPLLQDQDILAKNAGGSNKTTIDGDSYNFIGDVDGTWHALRTARTSRENGRLAVEFNFRAGCIKVVYNEDNTISSRMAYAGQNFAYDAQGNSTRVTLPYENFTTDEHLWEGVESSALTRYRELSGNASATENALKDEFRTAYRELYDSGIIAGYRCSSIKIWDVLCLDYKYSPDSLYGFDGVGSAARERMYTMVYSGVQKHVYGVGDNIWNIWRDDSTRRSLGAPISNAMNDVTISGIKFARIQVFEQGYIYENEKGALMIEYGATTDNEYKQFKYKAAPPEKPEKYGTEKERFETTENGRNVVYINYAKGAVKATEMYAKLGYVYDYYPGRNFAEVTAGKYEAAMLDYDDLYSDSDFVCEDYYKDMFNGGLDEETGAYVRGIREQLKDKIQELLDKGFFPGFFEDKFKSWNGAACQQFIFGDSTALPWGGDSRTNVSAMIWNEREQKVFLLKDAFMEVWGGVDGAYTVLGAPASEEFKLSDDSNVTFQYFYGMAAGNNKAFAACVGYNEATYYAPDDSMTSYINPEQYLLDIVELSTPLSGVKIIEPASTTVRVNGYTLIEFEIQGAAADAIVTVASSDESIAEVMADNSVEFHKAGTVTITVTVTDGVNTFSDSVTFNVVSDGKAAAGITDVGVGGNIGGLLAIIFSAAALIACATIMAIVIRKKKQAA